MLPLLEPNKLFEDDPLLLREYNGYPVSNIYDEPSDSVVDSVRCTQMFVPRCILTVEHYSLFSRTRCSATVSREALKGDGFRNGHMISDVSRI